MIRAEKVEFIKQLNESFSGRPHLVLAQYSGLTVNQVNDLRAKLGEVGATYRVVKNRLAKRAAEGTSLELLSDQLSGPCAVASHESDPVVLAKTLAEFVKENPQIELLAGVIDASQTLDQAGVEHLSSLPGLPELQAQLLALIMTPATTLVRLVATPGTQIARVLDAKVQADGGAAE